MRPLSPTLRAELRAVVALLAVATALFWTTRLDLAAGGAFHETCCGWPLAEQPFWHFVYAYGVFAGVLLAAAALVVFTLTFWYPRRLHAWRRPALFLVLTAALGPGLLVNVIFKDHYGRPRPREVQELGGQERFLPVWAPGADRQAKSFPCGHCSMGFYLSTPWLVLKRRRRKTAWAFLLAGLFAGGLLGVARMMAGGHFLSDVVWAGGLVWLTALGLHHALDLERPSAPPPDVLGPADRRRARLATAVGGGLLAALTLAALLATPYVSSRRLERPEAEVAALRAPVVALELDEATLSVEAGPALSASYDVQAFGLPTSRIGLGFVTGPEVALLRMEKLGWFTERRTTFALRWPADGAGKPLHVRLGKGRLALDLRGFTRTARLEVDVGEGEVRVKGAEALDDGRAVVRVAKGAILRE